MEALEAASWNTLAKRHDDLLAIKIERFLNNMIRLSDVYLLVIFICIKLHLDQQHVYI